MKKAIGSIVIGMTLLLVGCGNSPSPAPKSSQQTKPVTVAVSPSTQQTIDQGQTVDLSATLTNDTSSQGVTWSLSGTGCSGSACGSLTNTTATGATYNAPASVSSSMTVSVTATSVKDTSVSASDSIVVNPAPVVTTASLSAGTTGTAYSATLDATGGTGNLSWSVSAGTLPAGLSLSQSGAISGTPTTAGTSTFTVQVTDSAATPESATQQLSITIAQKVTMSITTTSLPDGTVSVAYTATLQVSGEVQPVSWSVTAGTLPSGLMLDSSTGAITGTPATAGTSTFTVTATDSTTPTVQTDSQQLSITINASGANNSVLSGHYAFLLNGYDTAGNRVAVAGAFQADASGNISNGIEDINNAASGPEAALTFDGTYSIGPDNTGMLTITNSNSEVYTMAVAMGSVSGGIASKGSVMEYDASGLILSGSIVSQQSSAFTVPSVTGQYVFGFSGSDSGGARTGVVGEFFSNASGGITKGTFDANDSGTLTAAASIGRSTYTVDSSTGRGTLTLAGLSPDQYAFYVVTASKFLAISLNPSVGVLSGEMDEQSGGSFSASSLNGPVVIGLTGASATGGSHVVAGLEAFDGAGTFSYSLDDNESGTVTSETGPGTYTTPGSSTGRFTFTPQGGDTVTGYLIQANQGFVLSSDSGVTAGTIQPQSGAPFTDASLNYTAFFGTEAFAAMPAAATSGGPTATLSIGEATFDGSGGVTVTTYENQLGTLRSQQDTDTYSVDPTGRVTLGSNSMILYIVSPTKIVTMSTTASDANPTLGFGQQ